MLTFFLLLFLGIGLFVGSAYLIAALLWYLLLAAGRWRLFEKMGIEGWKGLIPFYADYILYSRCWSTPFFWGSLAAALVSSINSRREDPGLLLSIAGVAGTVLDAALCWKVSRAFGHGIGCTLLLIFLNPIGMLYLGFGPDPYLSPQP